MKPNCCRLVGLLWSLFLAPLSHLSADDQPTGEAVPTPHYLSIPDVAALKALLKPTGERLPIVSAHRGGPADNLAENSIAAFEATLQQTYAFLEVDPRYTSDGVIVLHHDPTLNRTTTGQGPLNARTFAEVQQLKLKDLQGRVTESSIPTLDAALAWARGKTVLVLDQKDVPVETRVQKVTEHQAESCAILIVYSFDDARRCYELNPNILMEVMIPSLQKLQAFEKTGVPWENVIAFVGHEPPQDSLLLQELHQRGVTCLAGTSRHLDLELKRASGYDIARVQRGYQSLFDGGVDLFETDVPTALGPLLFSELKIPASKQQYFQRMEPSTQDGQN